MSRSEGQGRVQGQEQGQGQEQRQGQSHQAPMGRLVFQSRADSAPRGDMHALLLSSLQPSQRSIELDTKESGGRRGVGAGAGAGASAEAGRAVHGSGG